MMTKEWVDDETMSVTLYFMASVDYLLLVIEISFCLPFVLVEDKTPVSQMTNCLRFRRE